MNAWVRLWHDMPTDPKWRVIARKSGQSISTVMAIFTMLMIEASRAVDRGSIAAWRDEDAAAALDIEEEAVAAVIAAMEQRVIVDGRLSGWSRRQPKREDSSTERVAEYRKRKRGDVQRDVTQGNAPDKEEDTDTDHSEADASAAEAAQPPVPPTPHDLRAAVFASGVPMLTSTGLTDANARSMLGRWRKTYTDGAVLDALSAAQAETPSDPIAWINRALEARNGNRTHHTRRSGWAPRPGMEGVEPAFLLDD